MKAIIFCICVGLLLMAIHVAVLATQNDLWGVGLK